MVPGVESKIRVSRLMVLTTRPPGAGLRLLGCLVLGSGYVRHLHEASCGSGEAQQYS